MNNEEIAALARQIAESLPPLGIKDPVLRQRSIDLNARHFEEVIKMILKTQCIVPKEKVIRHWNEIMAMINSRYRSRYDVGLLFRDLFGKEMFETTKTTDNEKID